MHWQQIGRERESILCQTVSHKQGPQPPSGLQKPANTRMPKQGPNYFCFGQGCHMALANNCANLDPVSGILIINDDAPDPSIRTLQLLANSHPVQG